MPGEKEGKLGHVRDLYQKRFTERESEWNRRQSDARQAPFPEERRAVHEQRMRLLAVPPYQLGTAPRPHVREPGAAAGWQYLCRESRPAVRAACSTVRSF